MKRLDFGSDHLGPDVFEYLNRPWTGQPRGLFNARFMNLSVKNVSLLFFIVKYRKGDSVVLVEPVLISTVHRQYTLAFPDLYSLKLK